MQDFRDLDSGIGEPAAMLAEAIRLHQAGRLDEAERLYMAIVEMAPDHADALQFLGVLRHQQNVSDEAVTLIRRSLALTPDNFGAYNNLGNVLLETGNVAAAMDAYRQVIVLRPSQADAHHNLGIALQASNQPAEAGAMLERAIALEPQRALYHYSLAILWSRLGRPAEALPLLEVAVALDPNLTQAHVARIRAIRRLGGGPTAALTAVDDWLACEPDNPVAEHCRAAYSGLAVPPRASDAYVRTTFEKYAASFDVHLDRLGYRAPEVLVAALGRALGKRPGPLAILDAGCGTGLCGPLLRPCATRLDGVDLSAAMLGKARERHVYDRLVEAELTEFIAARIDEYDVILSADTLVYFGDLSEIAAAAAGALRPEGLLIFSLEHLTPDDGISRYRLEEHGRYSHGRAYVRDVLTASGFIVIEIDNAVPRYEAGAPVAGLVIVALKRPLAPHSKP